MIDQPALVMDDQMAANRGADVEAIAASIRLSLGPRRRE